MWCGEEGRKAYQQSCGHKEESFLDMKRKQNIQKENSDWMKIQREKPLKITGG